MWYDVCMFIGASEYECLTCKYHRLHLINESIKPDFAILAQPHTLIPLMSDTFHPYFRVYLTARGDQTGAPKEDGDRRSRGRGGETRERGAQRMRAKPKRQHREVRGRERERRKLGKEWKNQAREELEWEQNRMSYEREQGRVCEEGNYPAVLARVRAD